MLSQGSTTKAAEYKHAMESDPEKVAQSVKIWDDLHGKAYVESGLGGLLTELKHEHDIQAAKPKAVAQLFEQKGGRFFTVWKDQHGVKIGCFACALKATTTARQQQLLDPIASRRLNPVLPGFLWPVHM